MADGVSNIATSTAQGAAVGGWYGAVIGAGVGVFGAITGRKARRQKRKIRRQLDRDALSQRETAGRIESKGMELGGVFSDQGIPAISRYLDESSKNILIPQQEADLAAGTVAQQFRNLKGTRERELRSYGLNPGDPRFRSTDKFRVLQAATEAGLRNSARRNARNVNFNRLQAAALFSQGLAATTSGILTQAAGVRGSAAGILSGQLTGAREDEADATAGMLKGLGVLGSSLEGLTDNSSGNAGGVNPRSLVGGGGGGNSSNTGTQTLL